MNKRLALAGVCAIVTSTILLGLDRIGGARALSADKPRVIVLGFDGSDYELTQQWMESGDLPNLKRLAEEGTYRPLDTANPAQSPVSWAVMETASNPGKTNLGDFLRRGWMGKDGARTPFPQPTGIRSLEEPVPADELDQHVELTAFERLILPLGVSSKATAALAFVALGVLLLATLLFKLLFRMRTSLSLIAGVLLAAGAVYGGQRIVADLPSRYPMKEAEMKGPRFWNVLGDAGVRITGLQVPAAFPCEANPNVRLTGGLFTPDVGGGNGAWYVYTNDEWAMDGDDLNSGGKLFKLYEDKDGIMKSFLQGPSDFVAQYAFEDERKPLEKRLEEPGLSDADRTATEQDLARIKSAEQAWREYDRNAKVDFIIDPDFDGRKVKMTIDGHTQEVAERDYSDYFELEFKFTKLLAMPAIARVYVEECRKDKDGMPILRLFVPPISIAPGSPPPYLPIATPRGFAGELADAVGLYDTVGWACYTNALKESELNEEAFLQGLDHVMEWRRKLLHHELGKSDWDVLFHVDTSTDRAGHLLYRLIDPEHPQYDAKDKDGNLIREQEVTAFGRTFKAKDGIKETYRNMDKIVGEVLDKIESGDLGPDVRLMIISDHGFSSFRYGVNVNVWLNRMGYLARKGEGDKIGAENPPESAETGDYFRYVDWERTRAYSMGLGKVYINLKGREDLGIVDPSEFDALKKEIIEKLETFVDPVDGHGKRRVVLKAYDAREIYEGEYEDEGGDIVLGLNDGYRASWQVSSGGYEEDGYESFGIVANDLKWAGDHCGVLPELVQGIFFANFEVPDGFIPHLMNVAPTVLDVFGVEIPKEWDGTPIPR